MNSERMVIGVTGKVGSGKSFLVQQYVDTYSNITLIDLDKIGHECLKKTMIQQRIIAAFGEHVCDDTKQINRRFLGDIAFVNKQNLNILNKIVHPEIKSVVENKLRGSVNKKSIIVGSLIKEIGLEVYCNSTIAIISNFKLSSLKEKISKIEKFQMSNNEYKDYCSMYFINNFNKKSVDKFLNLVQNLMNT